MIKITHWISKKSNLASIVERIKYKTFSNALSYECMVLNGNEKL